ncbi:MAG: acyl-ACP--UDP-N-acetylglucosamine O-acyltransferase [Endomicrobiales bacterium]|nr:acyl-ACP--UDP-N-acetylglucosamine O-acyltransferase [Endomicrobiales bacterium]
MIHKTAIIHPNAKIEDGVEIGPYAFIGDRTEIKRGTVIGAHAFVESAKIGNNCKIFNSASVGSAPQDLKYKNEETTIIIGDNTTVREFCTLNRGTTSSNKTVIGSNCLLMAYTHIAHDCVVGNGVIFANCATLGGHVEVGDNAILGGIVAVHQFCKIGKYVMIGGGSMVAQDIIPFAQANGNRVHLMGLNLVGLKRHGFSKESIEEIKSAYRTLFSSGLTLNEALDQIEAGFSGNEVKEIVSFIKNSKRGICRPSHSEQTEEL